MGFLKLFVKLNTTILILFIVSCKPEQKTKPKKHINTDSKLIIKDTIATTYPSYLTKEYVLGKFDYKLHPDFIIIPKALSSKTIYLRRDVFDMFHKMHTAAKKDAISLKIVSGTRNFSHQKNIWNRKWQKHKNLNPLKKAFKILEYSSMPSTSRHHWGTDIDINNLNSSYFKKGQGLKEYNWLVKNASKFGFYQVYTSKTTGRTGYNEEEWHWSYKLSKMYLNYYNENIHLNDITGFKGDTLAKNIDIIKNYVNGINPVLLNTVN